MTWQRAAKDDVTILLSGSGRPGLQSGALRSNRREGTVLLTGVAGVPL